MNLSDILVNGTPADSISVETLNEILALLRAELKTRLAMELHDLETRLGKLRDISVREQKLDRKKHGRADLSDPKYRDPENPDQTWSGQGKHPKWVKAYLESGEGRKLEDLRIPDPFDF